MEIAMLDVLAEQARQAGVETIHAKYLPTAKNAMVADHYEKLGFTLLSRDDTTGVSTWSLDIRQYEARTRHIKLPELSLKNG
jgi:predicted enzyme involved in methoxymalonyl-ACP biosynthesis